MVMSSFFNRQNRRSASINIKAFLISNPFPPLPGKTTNGISRIGNRKETGNYPKGLFLMTVMNYL